VRVAESPPNDPLFNRAAKKKPQGSEDSALRYRGMLVKVRLGRGTRVYPKRIISKRLEESRKKNRRAVGRFPMSGLNAGQAAYKANLFSRLKAYLGSS